MKQSLREGVKQLVRDMASTRRGSAGYLSLLGRKKPVVQVSGLGAGDMVVIGR